MPVQTSAFSAAWREEPPPALRASARDQPKHGMGEENRFTPRHRARRVGRERMAEAVFLGGFAALRKPRMGVCGWVIDRVTTAMRLGSRFGREPRVVLVPRTNPGLEVRTPLAYGTSR